MLVRDDIHKKKICLNGHCPLSSDPPPPPRLNGQGGPFSGRQKRHFSAYYRIKLKSILIIKMIISVMKIDDYGDENDQKLTNTMPFKSKYTPFRHNYLVKKRTKSTGQGSRGLKSLKFPVGRPLRAKTFRTKRVNRFRDIYAKSA